VKNGIKLPGVLAEYDKGNYTCIVQHHLNNMSRTFVLDILSTSSAFILLGHRLGDDLVDWKSGVSVRPSVRTSTKVFPISI